MTTFTFYAAGNDSTECEMSAWMVGDLKGGNLEGPDPYNQYLLDGGILNGEYPMGDLECSRRCQQMDSCMGFTYKTLIQQCWLKGVLALTGNPDELRPHDKSALKLC